MLHELFLFIGRYICYASCLATVCVGGFMAGAAVLHIPGFGDVLEAFIFVVLQSISYAGVSWI